MIEWEESVKNIYARNTIVKLIENNDVAQDFIDDNHRSYSANPNTKIISLGLYDDNELLAVAQFCTPRTEAKKRTYSTELLRLCFKKDYRIVGGASKLIAYYKDTYKPTDIFTYQDTTGDNTDVYEKCGFTLVSQDKTKKYLIAPGKNIDDAGKNEKLSIAYAAKLGPDNILGTKLGEVYNDDGTRKTNIGIFTDVLGWHLIETTGDKVYEWYDPNISYYTYKVTASDSDKYYYGVRCLRTANATVDDCMKDNYYGSGGRNSEYNKFKNWKNKHKNNLIKEIVGIYKYKAEAYDAEKILVADLWKTDPNCLNSIEGGRYTGKYTGYSNRVKDKECEIHGLTKHTGNTCFKCLNEKNLTTKKCEIHGDTIFIGNTCRKCIANNSINIKNCTVHGETKHNGNSCIKCEPNAFTSIINICEIHGETKFVNNICSKCNMLNNINIQNCSIHGEVKHMGNSCYLCTNDNKFTMKECNTHGLTKHQGNSCSVCVVENTYTMQDCSIHGLTKFYGNKCRACINENNINMKECSIHGLTKHIGEKCYDCREYAITVDNCEIHGDTKFNSKNKCMKCISSNSFTMQECKTHGLTKHDGKGKCMSCNSNKMIVEKECIYHGLSKHRGNKCCLCTVNNTNHRKFHKDKTKENCYLCLNEINEGTRKPINKVKEQKNCQLCGELFTPKNKNQVFCSAPHEHNCDNCGKGILITPRKDKKYYACSDRQCINAITEKIVMERYGVANVAYIKK